MLLIIRLLGLIALGATSWILAGLGYLMLVLIMKEDKAHKEPIRRDCHWCYAVEFAVTGFALAGIWLLPLVPPILAHASAIIVGVILLAPTFKRLIRLKGKDRQIERTEP
jgi:hypothetical protein